MDKQVVLIPRVPERSGPDEEIATNRISLSPSIKRCISGMGDVNVWEIENRIRVYTIDIDESDPNLVDWKTLYESGFGHESPLTQEYWYKERITPLSYSEYRVENIVCGYHLVIKYNEKKSH